MSKLWGGRFEKETTALVRAFNDSIGYDIRLYNQDIDGSIAWAGGLVGAGVLTQAEADQIIGGLEAVRQEIADDQFEIKVGDEDIHTAVERRMTEIVGPVGGKLHTGRSRNDQAVTDFRLWIMQAVDAVCSEVERLGEALIAHAEGHINTPMPGYTHLQHAQPVTWGHWLLGHFWPLVRDLERFKRVRDQADEMALGSAAFAGTAFAVDRAALARALNFTRITQNSLDGVSSRDYVADFLYAATMLGLHLSRLSEQLIIFSSAEFRFVVLDDAYSTGSSIMPQKKNPDTLELTRGKSGRLLGNLTGFLATLKGLPSTYDKDLQEDKEPVFDTFDNIMLIVPVMTGVIETLTVRPESMQAQLEPGLLATDLADYLVKKGLPFREAHHVIGEIIRLGETKDVPITELSLLDLKQTSVLFDDDVLDAFSVEGALKVRNVVGGTAPDAVRDQIEAARRALGGGAVRR